MVDLFGMFNHDITVKRDERITIITAPNGFGKTVILKLAYAFFSGSYSEYFKTGFRHFYLEFSDNTLISIEKSPYQQPSLFPERASGSPSLDETERPSIVLSMQAPRHEEQRWPISIAPPLSLSSIERHFPFLSVSELDLGLT